MNRLKEILSRPTTIGTIISLIAIAAIAFIYFYPDAAAGNELRQHDMQQGAAIGHEAQLFEQATGTATRWTNALFGGMPTFQISPTYPSNSLFGWINTVMGLGLPSPANLLAMMMIGFFILLMAMGMRWYVALLGSIAYGFSSYVVIIIGAGHLWKFITLAYVPPTIAGVVLCYRGRYLAGGAMAALFAMMQIAGNHVQMTYYFLFVTAAIAIAWLCMAIRKKAVRGWLCATGVLVLAASLAVTANLPSLYNTYEYSKQTMRGTHSELSAADTPAAASNKTSGLDRDYITQYSYGQSETFTLLIPNAKGGASAKPEKGRTKLLNLSQLPQTQELVAKGEIAPQEAQFLEYLSQYFGEPEGTNGPVYVGALIVAFFLLGCIIVKGPLKWTLLVMTALSLLLALGRNAMWLTDWAIDYVPMYNKFRTVESILVIAEFTMPLLAAMALQVIVSNRDRWAAYRKPVMWTVGGALAVCLLVAAFPSVLGSPVSENDRAIDGMVAEALAGQGYDAQTIQVFSLSNPRIYSAVETLREGMVRADALRSALFIAVGLGLLALMFYGKLSVAATMLLLALTTRLDRDTVNKRYLNTDSVLARSLTTPEAFPLSAADRQILADTASNYRVMDIARFWEAAPSYHHKTVGGYHAAKLTRYQDLITTHLGHFMSNSQTDADWEILNMLNAKYIVDPSGNVLLNPEALGNAWFVDSLIVTRTPDEEMAVLGSISTATTAVADAAYAPVLGAPTHKAEGDTIFQTSYAPNRLTYSARSANGGVAVFSEVFFPWGWHATVDGAPAEIGRVNYLLRALNIPAGSHTVEMWFDPESLRNTTTAAYVAIILIYIAAAAGIVLWLVRPGRRPRAERK